MELSYVVHATFRDAAVLDEWIAWLRHGHLADVMAGGALGTPTRAAMTWGSSENSCHTRVPGSTCCWAPLTVTDRLM